MNQEPDLTNKKSYVPPSPLKSQAEKTEKEGGIIADTFFG